MADGIERFLCIASYEKGNDFLRQCAEITPPVGINVPVAYSRWPVFR